MSMSDVEQEDSAPEMDHEPEITGKKHKSDLAKLKAQDPDFFKFLQEEDPDLLEFQESDEEQEDEEEESEDEDESKKSRIPKAKKDSSGRLIFDGNLFSYLQSVFDPEDPKKARKPETADVKLAVEAFLACVARVGADIDVPKYVINEQSLFEVTVRLVFQTLGDYFNKVIHIEPSEDSESVDVKKRNTRNFKKFKTTIKVFLESVLTFLNEIQTDVVIISTVKAIIRMLGLYQFFSKLVRKLIKTLVRVWSRKTIECRVAAYIALSKLAKQSTDNFPHIYKSCYLGFVSNAREVSEETWPLLQFMHRTFADLTLVSPDVAYPYAFVYIRQTAIHLRNAIISKKRKDLVQTVYNWQLIQCLYLWVRVISKAHEVNGAESICELVYPLTQVIIGVSKLYPSQRFLPLRFHCLSMLIQLQANCTAFIPTVALSCELLDFLEVILRRKPKTSKVKVQHKDLSCVLKINSQQIEDPIARNDLCQHLFRLILQASHILCNQPAFADLILPIISQMRHFTKSVRSNDAARLFKGLTEKFEAHSKFVTEVVSSKDVHLSDEMNVRALKFNLNNPDSPLRAYYRQWEKVWKMKQASQDKEKEVTKKDKKKPVEKVVVADDKVVKPKRKKVKIGPAASKADATVPDQVNDLGSWSDDE